MKNILSIMALAFILFSCQAQSGTDKIALDEYQTLEPQENTFVIDVRTPEEVSQGFIKGADYFFNVNGGNFEEQLKDLDKDATYIVYCRSGMRSNNAQSIMKKLGFTKVYDLKGGILAVGNADMIVKE
ncbi:MAG: rhodanese-like domain-containing protein [Chitinophagales bacterium]|nr:rhodanese-like domain-containing protein [Chitinophagales bacterium]